MSAVEALVLSAFASWLPHQGGDALAAKHAIAIDVVTSDPAEPHVYGSAEADACQLAALIRFEAPLVPWVEDGRCNDPAWRALNASLLATGDCDGGNAWTLYQLHIDDMGGWALTPRGYSAARFAVPGAVIYHGKDAVADPVLAARMALHVLRQSGMLGYTGESALHHPKADARITWARRCVGMQVP